MRVQVYRNLNQKCLSVMALDGPFKGRVVSWAKTVRLSDCKFVVRPAGRAKVLKEKRKNVHAFVRGDLTWVGVYNKVGRIATYNPYKNSSFVMKASGKPVSEARTATIYSNGNVYCQGAK